MHNIVDQIFGNSVKGNILKLVFGVALLVLVYVTGIRGRWLGFAVVVICVALYRVVKQLFAALAGNARENSGEEGSDGGGAG